MGRSRRPLVLVVEDDPDLGDTIVSFLKEEGLDAKLARDGDQAMRLVDQLHPSAMILDLMMPRRDGFSVLRELRADGRISHLPVIVVTAIFGSFRHFGSRPKQGIHRHQKEGGASRSCTDRAYLSTGGEYRCRR